MAISTADRLSQAFSTALEQRSQETQDLVTNNNALMKYMESNGMMRSYSGPTIRERIEFAQEQTGQWYSGYELLDIIPQEIYLDAEWVPKMLVVTTSISNEEVLANSGTNQLKDLVKGKVKNAQGKMKDIFDIALHGDGTANNGQQLVGLQTAVPTVTNSGTYGGIDRATQVYWQTSSYDAQTDFTVGTQVNSTTVRPMYRSIIIDKQRGGDGVDLILASKEHFEAFDSAVTGIQRIQKEGSALANLGFARLAFAGAGKEVEIVLDAGIRSNMPANTSYLLDTKCMAVRYHPKRKFAPFGGEQMPINQDAIVKKMGFMGELTVFNPLFQSKLYDSNLGS